MRLRDGWIHVASLVRTHALLARTIPRARTPRGSPRPLSIRTFAPLCATRPRALYLTPARGPTCVQCARGHQEGGKDGRAFCRCY